jgi:hybrid cluster-associated redox disulfide protein
MAAVTKEMSIGEVVVKWPESAGVFMAYGLFCFGCAAARYETIEQGAVAHGIDTDALIKAINKEIEKTDEKEE